MTKRASRKAQTKPHVDEPAFLAKLTPLQRDLLSVAFLYILTLVVFRGIVFDNAAFSTEGDTAAALSYSHAGNVIAESEGIDVLWMPAFFSGMPTFGNVAYVPHNVSYVQTVIQTVLNLLFLNGHWTWLVVYYFLSGLFMFLLMRVLDFSRPAAVLGAVLFMLAPFNIGLASEGHGSKLMALSYVPLVFLLTHLLFERRDILSFGLLAAAIGTLALTNHMQIVYYAFIVIGLYLLYTIVVNVRTAPGRTAWITALFVGALVLGLCIASYIYLSVYEYAQFSIRGGGTAGSTGGLTWEYATNWSWNPLEMATLFIPSFFGFQTPYYWGTMPFTNSTVYIGILPLLLAILGVAYHRTRLTVFLLVLTVVFFLMSFGKHFAVVYDLLFTYLPFFNKFRAPQMVLHLLPFIVGLLAGYGLEFLLRPGDHRTNVDLTWLTRTLLIVAGALFGVLIIAALMKSSLFQTLSGTMFVKEGDIEMYRRQYGNQVNQVIAQLKESRFDALWKDFVKFVFLAVASIGIVVLFLKRKLSTTILTVAVFALILTDLLIVINKGGFIAPKPHAQLDEQFKPDATVAFLQQQPGLFRIYPLGNLFMDNTFAYHGIQSIGGYSAAKLKIYQSMLDSCLFMSNDPSFPINMHIVNMLNTEFLVAQGQLPEDRFQLVNVDNTKRILTYRNPGALARTFFVDTVLIVPPSGVYGELNSPSFDPARMAVVQKTPSVPCSRPDSAQASIIGYQSRKITIQAYTSVAALLVLSEVYYPAGWTAAIDGQETEILQTNAVLRSVVVPPGSHEIVYRFDPPMYAAGYTITRIAWAIALCCVLIGLWQLPAVRARFKRT